MEWGYDAEYFQGLRNSYQFLQLPFESVRIIGNRHQYIVCAGEKARQDTIEDNDLFVAKLIPWV